MNKFFTLIASLFLVLAVNAQTKTTTAIFDFTKGETLTPQVIIPEGSAAVNVGDYTFTEGSVNISFRYNATSGAPDFFDSQETTELRMYRDSYMDFVVANNVELLSIKFTSNGMSAYDANNSQGTIDHTSDTWKNVDSNGKEIDGIHKVSFHWTATKQARIKKIVVTYREPQNTLAATTIVPAKGAVVNSFKDLVITFNKTMGNVQDVALKNGSKTVGTLKQTSVDDKTVTLSLDEELTEPGKYSVEFDRATCTSADEFFNAAFSTNFTIEEPKNTFNPISVPDEKVDEAMPATISIEFPGNIGNRAALSLKKFDVIGKENGKVATTDVSFEGFKTMVFTLSDVVNVPDVYTITIPEQTVYDVDNSKYNDEFVITYRVAGADAPSDAVLQKATELLENTGLGYPTENAKARVTLAEMVKNHNQGDEAFNQAIKDFLSTSEVNYPQAGKYYSLTSVSKNGTKWYVAYSKGAASLTSDASKAYSFLAGESLAVNNGTTLKTLDGKYLAVLGTTSTNVSESEKVLNIKKMAYEGEEEATFGLFSIDNGTLYSTVKVDGSVRDEEDVVKFNDSYSAAFLFAEAAAPKEEPTETSIQITINPATTSGTIERLQNVTVTFPTVQGVNYDQTNKVYVVGSEGNKIYATGSTANTDKNEYVFTFPSLVNDTYMFVAPEGAFTYTLNGKKVFAQEAKKAFTVYYVDDFSIDYLNIYTMYLTQDFPDSGAPITQFNNFSMYFLDGSQPVEPFATNNEIKLTDPGDLLVSRGKLAKREEVRYEDYRGLFRNGEYLGEIEYENAQGDAVTLTDHKVYNLHEGDEIRDLVREVKSYFLDIKFDKEISAEDARDGVYQLHIPKASFGDATFGAYLASPSTVSKRDCHVNPGMVVPFHVNNTTGITSVKANAENAVIFDLSGRRVADTSRPGIYIINGKKFIVK